MFTIDKHIPVPRFQGKYPFKEMEVGDSFTADDPKVIVAARSFGNRFGKKFTARRNGPGYRVWRVA